ncbi:small subunit ribosomal protein S16 [Methylophilus rhizosphaerae]|uniref:Small ribosomal subunit protein bS16 n=1 Tax=Methylophilus rhizosphaerae TaxID=492660 RepID=A0A1G9CKM5_9PROT|nr:30S ribosomal protein S16 [Methylophilus rhizosphaerae]SDK52146.1 small subunit ribosomal protein S16 [Methylophilus rhizosphaerae]
MVVIRLSRGGSKKNPFYSVVVADSRNRRDGRFVERIGFYNPSARAGAEGLRINEERAQYWIGNGAQLSDTVARLVKFHAKGVDGMAAVKAKEAAKADAAKAKKEADAAAKLKAEADAAAAEAAEKAKAEAEAAATAETPAAE